MARLTLDKDLSDVESAIRIAALKAAYRKGPKRWHQEKLSLLRYLTLGREGWVSIHTKRKQLGGGFTAMTDKGVDPARSSFTPAITARLNAAIAADPSASRWTISGD